jgi:hypothetical protein
LSKNIVKVVVSAVQQLKLLVSQFDFASSTVGLDVMQYAQVFVLDCLDLFERFLKLLKVCVDIFVLRIHDVVCVCVCGHSKSNTDKYVSIQTLVSGWPLCSCCSSSVY